MNKIPDVTIVTEASKTAGLGHAKRCITLAEELKKRNLKVLFAVNSNFKKDILSKIENYIIYDNPKTPFSSPYIIRDLKNGSNSLIVEQEIKNGSTVLLIDDKGGARKIATMVCDIFMTPKEAKKLEHGTDTKYLYGLKYSIINHNLVAPNKTHEKTKDLFIYISTIDPHNITYKMITELDQIGFNGPSTVVLSNENKFYHEIANILMNWNNSKLYTYKDNIYHDMAISKLTITKVGMTMIESFFVGTPCITIEPTNAHLQLHKRLINFYKEWPAILTGIHHAINYRDLAINIRNMLNNEEALSIMGKWGKRLIDGKGATRIIDIMLAKNDKKM